MQTFSISNTSAFGICWSHADNKLIGHIAQWGKDQADIDPGKRGEHQQDLQVTSGLN